MGTRGKKKNPAQKLSRTRESERFWYARQRFTFTQETVQDSFIIISNFFFFFTTFFFCLPTFLSGTHQKFHLGVFVLFVIFVFNVNFPFAGLSSVLSSAVHRFTNPLQPMEFYLLIYLFSCPPPPPPPQRVSFSVIN